MTMRWLLLWACLITPAARAETIFEGFYRVERAGQHVGFGVQRLRRDGDQRVLTTYYRMKQEDGSDSFESFKATSSSTGAPIRSEYAGNKVGFPAAFAEFRSGHGRVDYGAPNSKFPEYVKGATRLSSALFFFTDFTKMRDGEMYSYDAFSEKHGDVNTGTLHALPPVVAGRTKVYHVLEDYNGEPLEHFVAANGQPLGSRTPRGDFQTVWVKSKEDAVGDFGYPNADVIKVFGDLPTGQTNAWASANDIDSNQILRTTPRWKGQRARGPAAIMKAPPLPGRSL